MIDRWEPHGTGFVAPIVLRNGTSAQAVVAGPRDNPSGLGILLPATSDEPPRMTLLDEALPTITAETLIDLLAAQHRAFGHTGLPALDTD